MKFRARYTWVLKTKKHARSEAKRLERTERDQVGLKAKAQRKETSSKRRWLAACQDGKVFLNATAGSKMVDRLLNWRNGNRYSSKRRFPQLFGSPRFLGGRTDEKQAEVLVSLLGEWNLEENVMALGFYTTSSNTGSSSDCCVWL